MRKLRHDPPPSIFALEEEKHAVAKILETWKGDQHETVNFLASPTWTCDISDAIVGEEAVLFLKNRSEGLFEIQLAGRGRMPVRNVKGARFATFWDQVVIPESVPTIEGPEPRHNFIRSIKIEILKQLVSSEHHNPAAKQSE